ncbi:MAG: hypothetical protein WCH34_00920 [Bacteroidota bacterium]
MKKISIIIIISLTPIFSQYVIGQSFLDSLYYQVAKLDSAIKMDSKHSLDVSKLKNTQEKLQNNIDSIQLVKKKSNDLSDEIYSQFSDHQKLENISEISLRFKNLLLPIPFFSYELNYEYVGKFDITDNYIGFIIGQPQSNLSNLELFIYDKKGNFIDWHTLSEHSASFKYNIDVNFEINKDLILNLKCKGDDCSGYPEKCKIINGKILIQK